MTPDVNWTAYANCASTDPDLFVQDERSGGTYFEARKICGACEVREICLKEALATEGDDYGFFGGKTVAERKALRRAQGDAA